MLNSINLVFSNHPFIILAAVIFVGMFIPLSIISEYIFFEPFVLMYVPYDRLIGFSLIVAVSAMAGLVLSMNVYRIRILHRTRKMGQGLLGSIIGASAGACSCGPIGFAIISSFGPIAGATAAFLTNYEIPLRLVALTILGITLFTTSKSLSIECKIK